MLKFLRKYNKLILVVGGSILMVLFLLPTTAGQLYQTSGISTVARMDGRKITVQDLQDARQDIAVVGQLAPSLLNAWGIDSRRPEHWLLLTHEARRSGLIGGPREARTLIPADRLQSAVANFPPQTVDRALAHLNGIWRLTQSFNPSRTLSTSEAIALGQRMFSSATIGVVTIPALQAVTGAPEPDESRLLAHFEKYRDVDPSNDPDRLGYRMEPAVKLEWFGIDRLALQTAIKPDEIEVNKHYRQNQARYGEDFAAVRTRVELDYVSSLIDTVVNRTSEAIRREMFRSTAGIPAEGVFKLLPEDWDQKKPALSVFNQIIESSIQQSYPTATGVALSGADDGSWKVLDDLFRLDRIGPSFVDIGNGMQAGFGNYVISVRELGGSAQLGLQRGLFHGPTRDSAGNLFWFRVTDVRKAGPPESIESVRARVIEDVKIFDALEALKEKTEEFRTKAAADGLGKLAEAFNVPVQWSIEVTREMVKPSGGNQPILALNSAEFRDAVIAAAEKLDPRVDAEATPAEERTVAVVQRGARGIVVAQVQRWRPMTVEQFRRSTGQIGELASRSLSQTKPFDAFALDRVAKRLGLRGIEVTEEQSAEEQAPAPAAQP